jgi:hypothetical protein
VRFSQVQHVPQQQLYQQQLHQQQLHQQQQQMHGMKRTADDLGGGANQPKVRHFRTTPSRAVPSG